mgnify:FL=1
MEPITAAETQLLEAAHRGQSCDFRTAIESGPGWVPNTKDAASWGVDRVLRGAFLRHLVVADGLSVDLVGARIDGDLDLSNKLVPLLILGQCVVTGNARFAGATFTSDANFTRTTFTGNANFRRATFLSTATTTSFNGATFSGPTRFDEATFISIADFNGATFTSETKFTRTTFTGDAAFEEVTFTKGAEFTGATFTSMAGFEKAAFARMTLFNAATFTSYAEFGGATFTGLVWFTWATFAGRTDFNRATFISEAKFTRATFTGDAVFDGATFTGDAWFDEVTFASTRFDGATFTGTSLFNRATFTRAVRFEQARFGLLLLSSAVWEGTVGSEGLRALEVRLDGSVFREATRLDVTAGIVSAVRLRADEPLHLVVAAARVDLTDADLAKDSLIEGVRVPAAERPDGLWVKAHRRAWMDTVEWLDFQIPHVKLNWALTEASPADAAASIISLRRARVAGTTISGIDLRDCRFGGVHGLDEFRLADVQVLRSSKDKDLDWSWPRLLRSQRRLIVDELDFRGVATTISPATDPPSLRPPADPLPTARAAAGAYRAMRKGLEDNKDEPGAADFYYGEMEMRRRSPDRWWSAERVLLTLYWLISGYGLRAWRAIAWLAVVIGIAGWCFTNSDWVRPSLPASATPLVDPDSIAWPWIFAGSEAISLFRPAGTAGVTLVGVGAGVDLAVRILGPVLLALTLLAIRNRTKR